VGQHLLQHRGHRLGGSPGSSASFFLLLAFCFWLSVSFFLFFPLLALRFFLFLSGARR